MFGSLVAQIEPMSLGEGLHTLAFTVFLFSGVLCCFSRSGKPAQPQPRAPLRLVPAKPHAHRARRRRPAKPCGKPRARQLPLPLHRAA